jgi:hypothetical protein
MNVQELINELQKIEDKKKEVCLYDRDRGDEVHPILGLGDKCADKSTHTYIPETGEYVAKIKFENVICLDFYETMGFYGIKRENEECECDEECECGYE